TRPEGADAFGIGETLRDRPLHAVGDVLLDARAPAFPAGFLEAFSAPAGATIVDLQDGITPAREELRGLVEAPGVMDAEWTAVRDHHERHRTAAPGRMETEQLLAVAVGEFDGAASRQGVQGQPRPVVDDGLQLPCSTI